MRKLFFVLLVLVFASPALSNPWLVCDPQAGVTHYILTGPTWIVNPVAAQPDGSIRMDVSPSVEGMTQLTVKACKNDEVWGEQCSSVVPFEYVRPAAVAIPLRPRLQK